MVDMMVSHAMDELEAETNVVKAVEPELFDTDSLSWVGGQPEDSAYDICVVLNSNSSANPKEEADEISSIIYDALADTMLDVEMFGHASAENDEEVVAAVLVEG